VTDFEEHNHMTAEALAIVFSPNLLRAPKNDFAMILSNMGHTHQLVKALITHVRLPTIKNMCFSTYSFIQYHVIFHGVDPEFEVDQGGDDLDMPLPEEDEIPSLPSPSFIGCDFQIILDS
jgi:hypothetical protein